MTYLTISPAIALWLGIGAGSLFVIVLASSWVISMRNRRRIRRLMGDD